MEADYAKMLRIQDIESDGCEGDGVRIAVLDTEIPTLDDVPVSLAENFTDDDSGNGHATFIGSILFGTGSVKGICRKATSCFGKVFYLNVAKPDTVAHAVKYASLVWGADIINMSLGFIDEKSCGDALLTACRDASERGTVIVASSGNDGGKSLWPASMPEVISVGASNGKDSEKFSNIGKVDVVAPGTNLVGLGETGSLETRSGTSFSTALVSGLMALLLARRRKTDPGAKARDVRHELIKMCVDIGAIGFDNKTGYGFPFRNLLCKSFFYKHVVLPLRTFSAIIKSTVNKALKVLTPRRTKKYEQ